MVAPREHISISRAFLDSPVGAGTLRAGAFRAAAFLAGLTATGVASSKLNLPSTDDRKLFEPGLFCRSGAIGSV
jgi:hypothetical protein